MPNKVVLHQKNRTNVRSLRIGERFVRAAFKVLFFVAPSLAEQWAVKLFFTPERGEPSDRLREALSSGRPFSVDFRGAALRGWTWGDGEAVVYLVHGWAGRGGQLASFVPALVEAGYRVVTFDAPGHGESKGTRPSLLEFAAALVAVATEHGPPRAVIAHSLGGAATAVAMRQGLPVASAVFIGVPSDPASYFRHFLAEMGLPARRRAALEARLESEYGFRWSDLCLPRFVVSFRVPLLVVHDRADAEVPWSEGAAIAGAWPRAQLLTTTGLGHRRILRDESVVEVVVDFVRSHDSTASALGRKERSQEC